MKKYEPIDCNFYDILEANATLKKTCTIIIETEHGHQQTIQSRILDLYTKNKKEFMVLENNQTIRLDQIIEINHQKIKNFTSCKLNE